MLVLNSNGLWIESTASGAAGIKLNDNFNEIGSRSPKSNYTATTDPLVTSDSAAGYAKGSRWHNTLTRQIFICMDAAVGAAIWKTTTFYQNVLASTFSITSNDTWEDTGVSLTLPLGRYQLTATARGYFEHDGGATALIAARLYNQTASAPIPYSNRLCCTGRMDSQFVGDGNGSILTVATFTVPTEIRLQAFRLGGTDYTVTNLESDDTGYTLLQATQI
jgi:hypothetical protein